MKHTLAVAITFVVLLTGLTVFADKVVTYSNANSKVRGVNLASLPDGGCSVEICGSVLLPDAGPGYDRCTAEIQLSGANQTRCLNVISDATTQFKNSEGL